MQILNKLFSLMVKRILLSSAAKEVSKKITVVEF
jgi:hypothetical protein